MVSAFPEPFDSLVKAVHIQGDGNPSEAEGQAQGRRDGFAAQETDDQSDARREVHEHTACRNRDAFDAGRKEHHRNGRDDARRRQEQPLPALESPDPKDSIIIANGDDNGNEIGDDDSEMMKVLGLLEENASITAKQMSEQMDISTRKVSRLIKTLKESGKIIRVGSDRKGYWKIIQ